MKSFLRRELIGDRHSMREYEQYIADTTIEARRHRVIFYLFECEKSYQTFILVNLLNFPQNQYSILKSNYFVISFHSIVINRHALHWYNEAHKNLLSPLKLLFLTFHFMNFPSWLLCIDSHEADIIWLCQRVLPFFQQIVPPFFPSNVNFIFISQLSYIISGNCACSNSLVLSGLKFNSFSGFSSNFMTQGILLPVDRVDNIRFHNKSN